MDKTFIAACLQMNAGNQVANNLALASNLLQQAADRGAALAVLPEFFPLIAADETLKLTIAEKDHDGPIQNFLSDAAAKNRMYIVGGTLPIAATHNRVYSSCLLYGPDGIRLARYDKMHLFRFTGHKQTIDETTTVVPGNTVTAVDTALGRIGLAVCYDLRFPELFRAMAQPDIIVIPAAFTRETGMAHWELLLRTRAVENLAHVLAPAQAGTHPGGRKTYGYSMIIDYWGNVLAQANGDGNDVIIAEINAEQREKQRQRLPALNHRLL